MSQGEEEGPQCDVVECFVVDVNGTEAANHRREQRPDPKGPGLEAIHKVWLASIELLIEKGVVSEALECVPHGYDGHHNQPAS